MDILQMVTEQGIVAWIVLTILAVLSLLVWAAIFLKTMSTARIDRGYDGLQSIFRQRGSFQEVRSWCWDQEGNPYARVVLAAASEIESLGGPPDTDPDLWAAQKEAVTRALGQSIRMERERARRWMPLLATAGNVSPFIGLFGTVWGIMRSFHEIGLAGAASLAVVAPGISEALLATAAGLFAAIPAVMAFNHFRSRISAQVSRMQDVADEVLNLLERERLASLQPARPPLLGEQRAAGREDA